MILIPPVVVDLELPVPDQAPAPLETGGGSSSTTTAEDGKHGRAEVRGGASASRLDATWAAADSGPSSGGTTTGWSCSSECQRVRTFMEFQDNTVNPYRRAPLDDNGVNPYLTENEFFKGELETPLPAPQLRDRELARHRDHWEVISSKGVLRRRRVKWRLRTLSPWRHLRFQWS